MPSSPMLRGFWKLTWLEIKIFVREPMGVIGTVVLPVILFVVLGRSLASRAGRSEGAANFLGSGLPVFGAILIAISAVLSLIAIISIYREGGILKRLRATPLRPLTILGSHVVVKLAFTALTLMLLLAVGKRFVPVNPEVNLPAFILALLFSTLSILSLGFVVASLVPTARFAQPIGSLLLYPMLAVSGIFAPVEALSPVWRAVATVLPVTHAVSLLRGVWNGAALSAHMTDVGALVLTFVVCSALASRVFRWE